MLFKVGDIVRYKPSIHPKWADTPITITGFRFEGYTGYGTSPNDGREFTDCYLGDPSSFELFDQSSEFEVDI